MIDLTEATNCIRVMQENGTYRNHKIGRINIAVNGLTSMISGFPFYREGQIVLFYDELTPSDSELCKGEYRGMEQKPTGRVTIEKPFTQEEIDEQKAKGSPLINTGTIIGVPKKYVEEIKI